MPESFDRARLGATLRACRALRHELATPLSAAALHLEVARRGADRAGVRTLAAVDGNKKRAAEILKVSLKTVYNKIKQYGLEP